MNSPFKHLSKGQFANVAKWPSANCTVRQ